MRRIIEYNDGGKIHRSFVLLSPFIINIKKDLRHRTLLIRFLFLPLMEKTENECQFRYSSCSLGDMGVLVEIFKGHSALVKILSSSLGIPLSTSYEKK